MLSWLGCTAEMLAKRQEPMQMSKHALYLLSEMLLQLDCPSYLETGSERVNVMLLFVFLIFALAHFLV